MKPAAGLSFKAEHFADALETPAADLWFEVHAENYMMPGGPRLAMLAALRERFDLSLHGVGMSLAGAGEPDADHLARLKALVDRFKPALVSEHLAWSRLDGRCFPDLLPFPRTSEVLRRTCANIARVQDVLGRQILVENPSHYVALRDHQWGETSFLREIVRQTGCGLLIDVNNVVVAAHNLRFDADSWLDDIPAAAVGEIHLAGHSLDAEGSLLIDSHDAPVAETVCALYARLVERIGPRPTLIERDGNLPAFAELLAERARATAILASEAAYV
ncbi:DUF692 domain-containing protein [Sphingomonas ginkgonis]|uniref:DUF692 domain-containing protein n=1 Tax=Sphingomonas ginkgonis TaxID=2315330 RepID=A0A3R9WPF6_9SPHN|nr:DUF692 domain-containing protein [Sphingomonas ginkgonis]RST31257.1 DUF692 domain-containing protein [Sphingomonas ginkgonis]